MSPVGLPEIRQRHISAGRAGIDDRAQHVHSLPVGKGDGILAAGVRDRQLCQRRIQIGDHVVFRTVAERGHHGIDARLAESVSGDDTAADRIPAFRTRRASGTA